MSRSVADTDDVEENRERPPSNKEIVEALSVLGRAVQHSADEKFFEHQLLL